MMRGYSKLPILSVVLSLLILSTVAYRYYEYMKHNYLLTAQVPCDTAIEKCFIPDCTPEQDPECDTTPYKHVQILASEAPKCIEENNCDTFSCDISDKNCAVTYCSDTTVGDGEKCDLSTSTTENNGGADATTMQ